MKNFILTLVFSFISLSAFAQIADKVKIASIKFEKNRVIEKYRLIEAVFSLDQTQYLTVGVYPDTKPNEVKVTSSMQNMSIKLVQSEVLEYSNLSTKEEYKQHQFVYSINGLANVKYLIITKDEDTNAVSTVIFSNNDSYDSSGNRDKRMFTFDRTSPCYIKEYLEGMSVNYWKYKGNVEAIKIGVPFFIETPEQQDYKIECFKF